MALHKQLFPMNAPFPLEIEYEIHCLSLQYSHLQQIGSNLAADLFNQEVNVEVKQRHS